MKLTLRMAGATLGLASVLAGCGPTLMHPSVTYVATATPGLKYVIVAHDGLEDEFGKKVMFSRKSEYVLLCDGRGVDGMHCTIPPEVGSRPSVGPTLPQAPAPVPAIVGALSGHVTVEHQDADAAAAPVVAPPVLVTIPPPVKAAPVRPKVGK